MRRKSFWWVVLSFSCLPQAHLMICTSMRKSSSSRGEQSFRRAWERTVQPLCVSLGRGVNLGSKDRSSSLCGALLSTPSKKFHSPHLDSHLQGAGLPRKASYQSLVHFPKGTTAQCTTGRQERSGLGTLHCFVPLCAQLTLCELCTTDVQSIKLQGE